MNTILRGTVLAIALLYTTVIFAQPTPIRDENGYRIGPYPIPIEHDGIKASLWTWLIFEPFAEPRIGKYGLRVTAKSQLSEIRSLITGAVLKKLPRDNCARYSIDNWVYTFNTPELNIASASSMNAVLRGSVSTWTCASNPIPETVCEGGGTYRDSFGITWPALPHCYTRPGQPLKSQNLEQAFEAQKGYFVGASPDGKLQLTDYKPTYWFTGGSPLTALLNMFALVENNLSAIFSNAMMKPQQFELVLPKEFVALVPRYEQGRFVMESGQPWLFVVASVSTTSETIDKIMRDTFGFLWTGATSKVTPSVSSLSAPRTPASMTKERIHRECAEYAPRDPVQDCAMKMGFDYQRLPDK